MRNLPKILPIPMQPTNLPKNVKWLSGEGAGSWFHVTFKDNFLFEISRFSPQGEVECKSIYKSDFDFEPKEDFSITYPSHCQKVSIIQNSNTITFINQNL